MLFAIGFAAAGFGAIAVATRQRRRTPDADADPFTHVVAAASTAALVGYTLGDAATSYDSRLGYATFALAVLGEFVAHAIDAPSPESAA